jgi:F0F1-type ATP synthase assembly protein I
VSGASNDDRPPMVVAMRWVHQISSIAIEMALPAFLGHWADEHWGTEPWLVAVGALLGFSVAMVHLLALAKQSGRRDAARRGSGRADRGGGSDSGG